MPSCKHIILIHTDITAVSQMPKFLLPSNCSAVILELYLTKNDSVHMNFHMNINSTEIYNKALKTTNDSFLLLARQR